MMVIRKVLKRSDRIAEVMDKAQTSSLEAVESETSVKPETIRTKMTACDTVKENGHCSPSESLNNGVETNEEGSGICSSSDKSSAENAEPASSTSPSQETLPSIESEAQTNVLNSPSTSPSSLSSSASPSNTGGGTSPYSNGHPSSPHLSNQHTNHSAGTAGSNQNHQPTPQGASPNCFSPINGNGNQAQLSPRGSSPHNHTQTSGASSPPNHQHVVHVHINAGETFSVRVGDQIQRIPGPATVRMVSNNGPPLPMPMQVPPGHMVQQIVDERGILTHVILSQQPPAGMGMPQMTVGSYGGPSNGGPQYYPYYPAHPYHHTHPVAQSHVPTGAPPHNMGTPPPQNCSSGPGHMQGPTQANDIDPRSVRQRDKTRPKYNQRRNPEGYYSQPRPARRMNKHPKGSNGDVPSNGIPVDTGQDMDAGELDEKKMLLMQQLSAMPEPKVSGLNARSAIIHLKPPELDPNEIEINTADLVYELLLLNKGEDSKYKSVYSGYATEITLKDLKPATEFSLKTCVSWEDVKGSYTDPVKFVTDSCEPDPPDPPKLSARTKTSISLKWNSACDNGSKVTAYSLECDKGTEEGFIEIFNGPQKQHRVNKLTASTKYVFRLAAINAIGKSLYSEPQVFCTSGSVPSQPDPPMLSEPFVNALIISWIKQPHEDSFILQMDDETTGHGFLPCYNGPDLSYKVKQLLRNTEYRFRLAAVNDEGQSKYSDVVCYRTLSERPHPPLKPQIKGKIHANSFRVVWEPPKDCGGSEITKYIVELDDGRGYETLYEGSEREHVCDHLAPGQTYMVRVACCNAAGRSDFSDFCVATTQAVAPGQCHPPKLQGKPKATSLHLRWNYPSYNGGADVTEFAVQMISPDNTCREVYKGHDLDCIVAGLSPGRPYLLQVRAFNRVGGGPWSALLEVVSGAGVPDPPKTPMVNCRSPHSALVSWEAPVNNGATVTDYRLEWQHKSDLDFSQLYIGPNTCYEVKNLSPATLYSFRVQAINSAGSGPFSSVGTGVTPASSPSQIVYITHKSTAHTITLTWKEPKCNGSDISAYNIDIGEKQLITTSAITEYTIDNLLPETAYKVRIQAVNGIGVGPFSAPIKVTTRPLPPNPSKLECVNAAPNSLKLKWGDGRSIDLLTYTLEMEKEDGNFQAVYQGSLHTFKVNKLAETTEYDFRIMASNSAGSGPYSDTYTFKTTKAPPPAPKAPKVQDISLSSCSIEWTPCKSMGSDSIIYSLQMQSKDFEYRQVYKGSETFFSTDSLIPNTEYYVRVCAIRVCEDGSDNVIGPYSSCTMFRTQSHEPVVSAEPKESHVVIPRKQLTDQQRAMIILLVFCAVCALLAFIAIQVHSYLSSPASSHSDF